VVHDSPRSFVPLSVQMVLKERAPSSIRLLLKTKQKVVSGHTESASIGSQTMGQMPTSATPQQSPEAQSELRSQYGVHTRSSTPQQPRPGSHSDDASQSPSSPMEPAVAQTRRSGFRP
jgi:hypothetical protein